MSHHEHPLHTFTAFASEKNRSQDAVAGHSAYWREHLALLIATATERAQVTMKSFSKSKTSLQKEPPEFLEF